MAGRSNQPLWSANVLHVFGIYNSRTCLGHFLSRSDVNLFSYAAWETTKCPFKTFLKRFHTLKIRRELALLLLTWNHKFDNTWLVKLLSKCGQTLLSFLIFTDLKSCEQLISPRNWWDSRQNLHALLLNVRRGKIIFKPNAFPKTHPKHLLNRNCTIILKYSLRDTFCY